MPAIITPSKPTKMNSTCRGFYHGERKGKCKAPSAGIRPTPFLCEKHYIAKALKRKRPYSPCVVCGVNILTTQNTKSLTCSDECWKQNNIAQGNKRTIALSNSSKITKTVINQVSKRDKYICFHCGLKIDMKANKKKDPLSFHLDHLLPVLHKDSDHSSDLNNIDNLVASHRICNLSKGNRNEPTDKVLKKVESLVIKRFEASSQTDQHKDSEIDKTSIDLIIQIECPNSVKERREVLENLYNNGGFSKINLMKIGVTWPPKKGWKSNAISDGW